MVSTDTAKVEEAKSRVLFSKLDHHHQITLIICKITDTVKVEEAKSGAKEIADATRTTTTQEGVDPADDEVDEVTMITMMTMTFRRW